MAAARFLMIALVFFVTSSIAVLHGPNTDKEGPNQPIAIEMKGLDHPLNDVYDKAREKFRSLRSVPEATPAGFGTTAVLSGDHHTFALVHWSGVPRQRIFILTRKRDNQGYSTESFLWLSTNYGKTFDNVTDRFPATAVIEWYYISSNADKLIFADRIHRQLYVTLDEGDTFTQYTISFRPDTFLFQYTRVPNVATYDTYVLGYDSDQQSLWVSTNTGASWTQLGNTSVSRYAWRQLNSTYEDGSTVYFDSKVNSTAYQLMKGTFGSNGYTTALFDNSLGVFMPHTFALTYQYMFIQKNYTDIGISFTNGYKSPLWVSHYRNQFNRAYLPLEIQEQHYAVVDGSEGQVLLGVFHDPNNTNLYISEEAGLNYSISLEHIISPPEYDWIDNYPSFDVHVVEGLSGTILVNKRIYGSSGGFTVISFDKGGQWDPLIPPATDSYGSTIVCNLPCALHLHMYIDQSFGFQPILSQDSAPNIIMALGNIGNSLQRFNYSILRLYISDNGGVSWRELVSGYKEFQLINFGAFISIVDKYKPTYNVSTSCDEGHTWKNYTFSANGAAENITVVRMFTEFGEESQHATIFGYHSSVRFISEFEWLIIDLDYTTLSLPNCTSSDYFQWNPTDERSNQQCILGQSYVYERRIPNHCCLINYDYDRPLSKTPCYCTSEDFECQVGFERVGLNGPCGPMEGTVYPPPPPSVCNEGDYYHYQSQYRKIAGDGCVDGNETFYLPTTIECPVSAPADLFISTHQNIAAYNTNISFTLSQYSGSTMTTYYKWDFGDNSGVNVIQGYSQANTQHHSYAHPGIYTVTVEAYNNGGNYTTRLNVTMQDRIQNFQVYHPQESLVNELALFRVENITTAMNTMYYTPVTYTWNCIINGVQVISDHVTQDPSYAPRLNPNGTANCDVITSNIAGSHQVNFVVMVVNSLCADGTDVPGCPVIAPADMFVTASQSIAAYNTMISFTLRQYSGSTMTTYYKWDFGDNSGVNVIQGYSQANTQHHSYAHPGVYTVTVEAYNNGGNYTTRLNVTMQDRIQNFQVYHPQESLVNELALFRVENITTVMNTVYYTPVTYTWNCVINGVQVISHHVTQDSSYAPHFISNGTAKCDVTTQNIAGSLTVNFTIIVVNAPAELRLTAFSNNSLVSRYMPVGDEVTFSATPLNSNAFPTGTFFDWTIRSLDGSVVFSQSASQASLRYTFHSIGVFAVSVTARVENQGMSKTTQIYTSEYKLSDVTPGSLLPVYRVFSDYNVQLTIRMGDIDNYNGTLFVVQYQPVIIIDKTLRDKRDQTDLGGSLVTVTNGQANFSFEATPSGAAIGISLVAYNNVSNIPVEFYINVAGSGDYRYMRIFFSNITLPSAARHNHDWQVNLQNEVIRVLSNKFHLSSWQLQVNVSEEYDYGSYYLEERDLELEMIAHVTILPTSLHKQDIQLIRNISQNIYNNGQSFTFNVNNTIITVSKVDFGPDIITLRPFTPQNLTPIAVGVSVGVFVLIVIAVTVVAVVFYYWRKKYRSLEVRYTRLRQGPMRFTFTSEGETLEEEDYTEDSEKTETQLESPPQEEEIKTDDDDFTPFQ